jgi:hypothetical protein
MNNFSYHIIPIVHVYNVGTYLDSSRTSRLLSHIPTPVVDHSYNCASRLWSYIPTSVVHHGSGRMFHLRTLITTLITHSDSGRTSQLRSHIPAPIVDHNPCRTSRLRSHITTPVIVHDSIRTYQLRSYIMTPVVDHGSGRISWLWSHITTPVIGHDSDRTSRLQSCILTLVAYPNSGHRSQLQSYILTLIVHPGSCCASWLRSHILTLVVHHGSDRTWLRPYFLISVGPGHTACVTPRSDWRLHLVKLDDYNILQRGHLVQNRSSSKCMICSALKTSASHDSDCSSVRLMGCAINEHLVRLDLRENPNTPSGSVPRHLVWANVFNYHVRRVLTLRYIAMTIKPGHTWEKFLVQHTE